MNRERLLVFLADLRDTDTDYDLLVRIWNDLLLAEEEQGDLCACDYLVYYMSELDDCYYGCEDELESVIGYHFNKSDRYFYYVHGELVSTSDPANCVIWIGDIADAFLKGTDLPTLTEALKERQINIA